MRALQRLVLTGLAVVGAAACGGSDGGTGPGGGGSTAFTAKVDGVAWTTDAARLQVAAGSSSIPGSLTIIGAKVSGNTVVSISLFLGYIGATGIYPLGVNQGTSPGGTASILEQAGGSVESRMTPFSGAAGTLTVTTLTATRIAGTFSFVAEPLAGTAVVGNRTITEGTFDVTLPAGFTTVPANDHGSTVTATLGGNGWNAATVAGLGGSGVYSFGGQTATLSVGLLNTTPVNAPVTLNLLNGVKITVIDLTSGHSWGGVSGDVGTVQFTSVSPVRVTGTFSGTLQPGAGASGTLVMSGGTFDVKIIPQ